MRWRRLGLVYAPDGTRPWAKTHAMLPTPITLPDGRIRVLIACCDDNMVGRVGYIDVDGTNPTRVLAVSERPSLDIGRAGCFDDNGVGPCSVIQNDGEIWLYYVGYQLPHRIPYTLFTGLAVSRDDGRTFGRVSEVPILDRVEGELFFRTGAFVRRARDSWQMWYLGGGGWLEVGRDRKPQYSLRYIQSSDYRRWAASSREVLRPDPPEIGFSRPFITGERALTMWFAVRSAAGYSLACAESDDGLSWRRGTLAFTNAAAPWEMQMTCYPALVKTSAGTFMFYNGNGYGRTGLGVAVLED